MNDNKKPFRGLRVPQPPEGLRGQVLDRAREALARGPRQDLWTRLWESRTARLAWGTSVLALAVGHLVLSHGNAGPASEPPALATTASTQQEELADIINLPRLSFDVQSVAGLRAAEENES